MKWSKILALNKEPSINDLIKSTIPKHYKLIKSVRHYLKFMTRVFCHKKIFEQVLELFKNNKLAVCVDEKPMVLIKVLRPYCVANLTINERFQYLFEHYNFLADNLESLIPQFYSEEGVYLGTPNEEYDAHLVLKYDDTFRREAELSLSFVNHEKIKLYSVAFNFFKNKSGEYVIAITSLQGVSPLIKEDNALVVKELTKACFGYQPRYMLLEIIFEIAKTLQIKDVYAIRTNSHVYKDERYIKKFLDKMISDYDVVWENFNAQEIDNKNFVKITSNPRKSIEEIVSKKRSMYKKRYSMMDSIYEIVKKTLAK
ncbi:MAG: VirK/YbjX family protein [Succinivibrionaceae bacterium]